MLKQYIIREGFSFVMPDGAVKVGGDSVELPDDVAQQHFHKFEAQPEPEQPAEPVAQPKSMSKTAVAPSGDAPVVNPA